MRAVYEESKTPYKYGVILRGEEGDARRLPQRLPHGDAWFMVLRLHEQGGLRDAPGAQR